MIDIKALRKTADHCLKKLHAADTPHPTNWIIQMHPATILALCDEIERLTDLLGKANALCRIRADEIERLQLDAEKHRLRVALTQAEIEHGVSK